MRKYVLMYRELGEQLWYRVDHYGTCFDTVEEVERAYSLMSENNFDPTSPDEPEVFELKICIVDEEDVEDFNEIELKEEYYDDGDDDDDSYYDNDDGL